MRNFWDKLLPFFEMIGAALLRGLRAVGAGFKAAGKGIKNFFVRLGRKIAHAACAFGKWFVRFPKGFVSFWKDFGIGVANFFRDLPKAFKSKDGFLNLLVGTAATLIWCFPVFVVVYVLVWFLSK